LQSGKKLQMLLMKRGGQVIYMGPLGHHSHNLIEYFEVRTSFGKHSIIHVLIEVSEEGLVQC
jgi:hypothetical protein